MRKSLFFLAFFLLLGIAPNFINLNYASTVSSIPQDKVIYNLPYPGILPDNPLYFIKIIRDRVWEFVTRDNLKKAQLYLLLSDKRTSMAIALSAEGKNELAVTTLSKAEKYFEKIAPLVIGSKKQGVSASPEFINNIKISNIKHQEVITSFLKNLPQGQNDALNDILNLNLKIKQDLQSL